MNNDKPRFQPKPAWLRVPANTGEANQAVMQLMRSLDLHTVCEEAHCPNCGECFGRRTATFMILGRECTRHCTFCCVSKGTPLPPDPAEPAHLAEAVASLGLRYVVITSVTRDDLPDGGASHFAQVIGAIRDRLGRDCPAIEVLIPDFQGDPDALRQVVEARPEVINHNIETVPRLYPEVRPQADYQRSLALLRRIKALDATQIDQIRHYGRLG
jgi:lipoyl synthase